MHKQLNKYRVFILENWNRKRKIIVINGYCCYRWVHHIVIHKTTFQFSMLQTGTILNVCVVSASIIMIVFHVLNVHWIV